MASWREVFDGDGGAIGVFATPEQLKVLYERLADYLGDQEERAMKGKRPDYVVNSVVEMSGGKSRWREVGVGFVNEKSDSITLQLDAVPLTGKLLLTRPKDRSVDAVSRRQ